MQKTLKLIALATFVCVMFICSSCGSDESAVDTKKVELEIQLFKNICENKSEKYPEDIVKLSQPLQGVGKEGNWAFYPFYVKRIDLNKKSQLNYLTNKAGNDKKIKFVAREHRQFFDENIVDSLMVAAKVEGVNISEVLENAHDKPNYFVLSSDDNFKMEDKQVYYSTSEIQGAIAKFIAESNPTKVVILYQPDFKSPKAVKVNLSPESTKFNSELGGSVNAASSWKELYKEAIEHIHPTSFGDDVEHKAGHPEAYSYLVEAAKKAIQLNQKEELAIRLGYDVKNKEGLYKLYVGHEDDYNSIKDALSNGDISKLESIMRFKLELAEEQTQKKSGKKSDEHHEDEHDH